MIILFQFEQCEHSRPVRVKLTELAVDFVAINAPPGHPEKDALMERLFGNNHTPGLWETDTGTLLTGEKPILEWIDEYYGQ